MRGPAGLGRWRIGGVAIGLSLALAAASAHAARLGGDHPVGYVDRAERIPGTRTAAVEGWAADPDTADPIDVHVYVNGVLRVGATADRDRTDVGAAFPDHGPKHGYAVVVALDGGTNTICVYGINVGPGTNSLIACRAVTVSDDPFGHVDRVDRATGGAIVEGWAIDPDTADPIDVHVYVNGALRAGARADRERADVGRAHPGYGATHGYSVAVAAGPGVNTVCVYGINVAAGSNSLVGCRAVLVFAPGNEGVLPGTRIVAHYGSGTDARLGVLGRLPPAQAAQFVASRAQSWQGYGVPTVPAFEYIASVATSTPGPDGDYSAPSDLATLREWLDAVRAVGGLLVLDIQPGRTDFLTEVKRYESLLIEPDVGLALDPEWRVGPGEVPGQLIGSVSADEINTVTRYVADLVRRHNLPRKVVVVHQFTPFMVQNRERLEAPPELAIVIHLDGFGTPGQKIAKYQELHANPPFFNGFKLFLTEDTQLMSPPEVVDLNPPPVFVSYQ